MLQHLKGPLPWMALLPSSPIAVLGMILLGQQAVEPMTSTTNISWETLQITDTTIWTSI